MRFTSTRIIIKTTLAVALTLALAASAQAVGGPLTGELKVDNDRHRTVTVYIDGGHAAQLAPGQGTILRNVANGVRQVAIVSPRGHQMFERVRVDIGRRSRLRVAPRLGTTLIKNRSGIDMRVSINGRDLGVVRDNDRLMTYPMRPGNHSLTAVPAGVSSAGLQPVRMRFDVVAGEQGRVRLKRYVASLRITNPYPHRVGLHVNGTRAGRIGPGQSLVLEGQLPGPVTIALRRRGTRLATTNLHLAPGQRADWSPRYIANGDLRIRNNAAVSMRVKVDGVRYGTLEPGQVKVIRDLRPGVVSVTGRTVHGRRFQRSVRVESARVARLLLSDHMPVAQASYGHAY